MENEPFLARPLAGAAWEKGLLADAVAGRGRHTCLGTGAQGLESHWVVGRVNGDPLEKALCMVSTSGLGGAAGRSGSHSPWPCVG